MPASPRFLQLADVAEVLNISSAQVYALVRNGDLPAIKIGGRGQWRVEVKELETYIARMYAETREFVNTHRFGRADDSDDSDDSDDERAEDAAAGPDDPADDEDLNPDAGPPGPGTAR
jgi:excisionase family DNA binding protein